MWPNPPTNPKNSDHAESIIFVFGNCVIERKK